MVVGNSSGRFFCLFELSPRVVISQLSWTVEDGERTIEIPMDLHPDSDVMATITICGDLECHSLEADAVVGTDRPLVLLTEDVIKIFPRPGNER